MVFLELQALSIDGGPAPCVPGVSGERDARLRALGAARGGPEGGSGLQNGAGASPGRDSDYAANPGPEPPQNRQISFPTCPATMGRTGQVIGSPGEGLGRGDGLGEQWPGVLGVTLL